MMNDAKDEAQSRLQLMDEQLAAMIAVCDAHDDFLLGALLCDARDHVIARRKERRDR